MSKNEIIEHRENILLLKGILLGAAFGLLGNAIIESMFRLRDNPNSSIYDWIVFLGYIIVFMFVIYFFDRQLLKSKKRLKELEDELKEKKEDENNY